MNNPIDSIIIVKLNFDIIYLIIILVNVRSSLQVGSLHFDQLGFYNSF